MMKRYGFAILIIITLIFPLKAAEIPQFLAEANGEIEVVLRMTDNPGGMGKMMAIEESDISRSEKHHRLINHFKGEAGNSQLALINVLKKIPQKIKSYKSYWISNAVYIKGNAELIRQIAGRDDVAYVFRNLPLILIEPVASDLADQAVSGIEPGLDVIGVRTAWEMGLTGEGSIVCNFDTGVYGEHPALFSSWRGSNGATVAESWFDPYTNTNFPVDNRGHGTHTMGTMVGFAGADTVGVAIGAQWIAAGVVDRGGSIDRTIADILAAFEWAADPDGDPLTSADIPDVINNSWGVPAGFYGPCDMTFWDAIDNLEALGIVCVFAAGNEGPTASTIRTPADRISTQFNSFSVGAVDGGSLEVANFSSRGPSGCDGQTIKPEIAAPGVSIRSCDRNGGYSLKSGTSMAAPHISGVVAILRQFNSLATVDQIKAALIAGAIDKGAPGEDNDYGYGLVNILNSLYHMPAPNHPFMRVISINIEDGQNGIAEPGEQISFGITMENLGASGDVEIELLSPVPGIQILNNIAYLGRVLRHETLSETAFAVNIPSNYGNDQSISFVLEFSSGSWSQTRNFEIIVGGEPEIAIATINTGTLTMSFSDIGQFGLGENSINPAGGAGFRYPVNGTDFMKEAALLILANGVVSDGARDSQSISDNDFLPNGSGPYIDYPGLFSDIDGYASYSDSLAENPIGVLINQQCFAWESDVKFIIVEFNIENISGNRLNDLRIGLFCDWDLALSSGIDDIVNFDDIHSLGYIQDIPSGWCVGIRSITDYPASYRAIDNRQALADGFSDSEKIQFMSGGFSQVEYPEPGDYSHLLSIGPYSLDNGESEVAAYAFVIGESLEEIGYQAEQAFYMYPQLTRLRNDMSGLPSAISFSQNYPNPFNNVTNIDVYSEISAQLAIYNIAGQLVKKMDIAGTGFNQITWDGKYDKGVDVVSGMYLYRVLDNSNMPVKKMIFLK